MRHLTNILGMHVGSYEITTLLGKGGMGEVYRARDAKLKRDVAIKMLPEEFARDRDRVSRFQREAELLASLNHTNIAAVYDFVEQDSSRFLVLELVDGDTLADRIARGAMAIDEALPVAKQICDALEAAHARGVVHRDLKPANIKLLSDNSVKVLDFGLAKALDSGTTSAAGEAANSPTLSVGGSFAGMILGTAAYMSPEQARGLPVDARSDIFSFGCVLFEMLTGRRAFAGDTTSDILASVLKSEPDLTLLPANLDPRLRQLLHRALAKPVKQRWQAVGDVRFELEQVIAGPVQTVMASRTTQRLPWTLTAVAVVAAAGVAAAWLTSRTPAAWSGTSSLQLSINLPDGMELPSDTAGIATTAISPDGTRVAFSTFDASGGEALWVRSLGAAVAKRIEGAAGGTSLFWSPDSQWLGFFSAGKLFKVNVNEGTPRMLADAPNRQGGTWSTHDVILFVPQPGAPLMRMPAAGGMPVPLEHTAKLAPIGPVFLPDGNRFLFLGQDHERVARVGRLDSDRIQSLPGVATKAFYSQSGHLLFVDQGSLMAQRFELASLSLSGSPMRIADRVFHNPTGTNSVSVSETGVIAYRPGGDVTQQQLTWFDRTGQVVGKIGQPDSVVNFRLSPDQTRIALDRKDSRTGKRDVWLINDLAGGFASRFTSDDGDTLTAVWSPDSKSMISVSVRDGTRSFHLRETSGNNTEHSLKQGFAGSANDWPLDGRFLVASARTESTQWDIALIPMTGQTSQPSWFLQTPANEGQPRVSPNGKWIAYASDESGRQEIYVQSFPIPGNKQRISSDGGSWPRWRGDGAELIYVAPGHVVTSVPVGTAERFTAGKPIPLFRSSGAPDGPIGVVDPFEVSLDGNRFLMLVSPAAQTSISLILNWPSLLKQ
jgi:serine/threonine protein kinase/Tol biopolymer transport system component